MKELAGNLNSLRGDKLYCCVWRQSVQAHDRAYRDADLSVMHIGLVLAVIFRDIHDGRRIAHCHHERALSLGTD
ncbi:hypothetical protein BURCE16_02880 [Burkholderia cepacia]|nr:hypothetical protein BURCE16_02880 [Burkholderia cepacia]